MTERPVSLARPVLYSFRRCPYAIRARLALVVADIALELREVRLRDKPAELLAISPKATVPVLQLPDGNVLDESLGIMCWALRQGDPQAWLGGDSQAAMALIDDNDRRFKPRLDRYKYHVRFPEKTQAQHRAEAETLLQDWEQRLLDSGFGLTGPRMQLADAALFPFVRQFAGVEPDWWASAPYPALRQWLACWQASDLFLRAMRNHPVWQAGAVPVLIDRW